MSWTSEVVVDPSGKWTGNGCFYATKSEAEAAVADLKTRWSLVTDTRVLESDKPVNVRWDPIKRTVFSNDTDPEVTSELHEVAKSLDRTGVHSYEDATALARTALPGETETVKDNLADAIWSMVESEFMSFRGR